MKKSDFAKAIRRAAVAATVVLGTATAQMGMANAQTFPEYKQGTGVSREQQASRDHDRAVFENRVAFFLGFHLANLVTHTNIWERIAANGPTTFATRGKDNGFSGGIEAGLQRHMTQNFILGAMLLANFGETRDQHTFAPGSYLAVERSYQVGALARAGVQITPYVALFALAGIMFTNQKFDVSFGGPGSTKSETVPGLALGAELEAVVPFLSQAAGRPVTMSMRYLHVDWQKNKMLTPAVSPGFDYFGRTREQKVMVTLKFYLN